MQLAVAISETGDPGTIEKSMEKRREISATKPNAAPRADVDRVAKRVVALGYESIVAAVEKANVPGVSRSTAYRFKDYTASVGKLRALEEWVVKEEARLGKRPQPSNEEQDAQQAEWAQIGIELARLDPARYEATLDGLRDLLESVKLREQGIRKMFRATPDHDR